MHEALAFGVFTAWRVHGPGRRPSGVPLAGLALEPVSGAFG